MEFEQLIQRPESLRNDQWESEFLGQFAGLKLKLESDEARQGPDGWPYLFVRTGAEGTEPATALISWLAERGIGLVVNAHKMIPDYVFPYGMLWNFVETGSFLRPPSQQTAGEVVYNSEKKVLVGPPSEKYLPPYVREVIREFLRGQGYESPKVLVVSSADYSAVDLIFSSESLGNLPKEKHQAMAEMLAWFLPLHYTLVLGEERGLPAFFDL